jgi:hypothetical protein
MFIDENDDGREDQEQESMSVTGASAIAVCRPSSPSSQPKVKSPDAHEVIDLFFLVRFVPLREVKSQ